MDSDHDLIVFSIGHRKKYFYKDLEGIMLNGYLDQDLMLLTIHDRNVRIDTVLGGIILN